MAARKRGLFAKAVDRLYARNASLPPETTTYSIEGVVIPVDDNIKLNASLYRPLCDPLGTVLVRTPYEIGFPSAVSHARVFAARGYQVLLSSCRGTNGSSGQFHPGRDEAADGAATVAWMREQSWYTGTFATLGGSYLGYTQWALLQTPPADLTAAIVPTGPIDLGDFLWGTGALRSDMIAWSDLITRMHRGDGIVSILMSLRAAPARLQQALSEQPLNAGIKQYFDGKPPVWLQQQLESPNLKDEFWSPMRCESALEKARIPIFLSTGWDDVFLPQVMAQYETLISIGREVAINIGPGAHAKSSTQSNMLSALAWLDRYLAPQPNPRSSLPPPVRVYITGREAWQDLDRWPPTTQDYELYLSPNNHLSTIPPNEDDDDSPSTTFRFDPFDPTPSLATPALFDTGSGRSSGDTNLASRQDVLTFTSDPLTSSLTIYGKAVLQLYHSTDIPFADLFVTLSDVDANGQSRPRSEFYTRLTSSRREQLAVASAESSKLKLILTDCAHTFAKGHRIRVIVAGGCHPRYVRNPGTGNESLDAVEMRAVQHTIYHSKTTLSKLMLPVAHIPDYRG